SAQATTKTATTKTARPRRSSRAKTRCGPTSRRAAPISSTTKTTTTSRSSRRSTRAEPQGLLALLALLARPAKADAGGAGGDVAVAAGTARATFRGRASIAPRGSAHRNLGSTAGRRLPPSAPSRMATTAASPKRATTTVPRRAPSSATASRSWPAASRRASTCRSAKAKSSAGASSPMPCPSSSRRSTATRVPRPFVPSPTRSSGGAACRVIRSWPWRRRAPRSAPTTCVAPRTDSARAFGSGATGAWRSPTGPSAGRLPGHALIELALLALERTGMTNLRPVRRSGSPGGEAHFAATHKTGGDAIPTAIVIRKDGREIGRERVTDVRGALHHYGPATVGWLITAGQVLSGAREEAAAPGAPPVALFDGIALCKLLEDLQVGVVKPRFAVAIPDLELLEALRG